MRRRSPEHAHSSYGLEGGLGALGPPQVGVPSPCRNAGTQRLLECSGLTLSVGFGTEAKGCLRKPVLPQADWYEQEFLGHLLNVMTKRESEMLVEDLPAEAQEYSSRSGQSSL